ncbi:MAG: DNA helicase UvrD [Leptolyngbya sp.]|nr:MAG: DNA helicase UvrD [Leptolyngbya sp.]
MSSRSNSELFILWAQSKYVRWKTLVGQQIYQSTFGRGKIIGIEVINAQIYLNIRFCDDSTRTFLGESIGNRRYFQDIHLPVKKQRIQEQITEELNPDKQIFLRELREKLEKDFLACSIEFKSKISTFISFEEFQVEKSAYVISWIKKNLSFEVDLEQAAVISSVKDHVQVVARAGSGKTSTLINRAIFLQQHCGVKSDEMLLLAFNRDAVEKIRKDLTKQLSDNHIPHILTFHALAYALVHPEYNLLIDEPEGEQSKSRMVQDKVIDNFLRRFNLGTENQKASYQETSQEVQSFMMKYFREDWERIVTGGYEKSREEMLQYRRAFSKDTNHKKDIHDKYDSSLSRVGLDGKYYKSFGEKAIANFLFEHNISYKYEYSFWWDGLNYKPDFKIGDKEGIIIEYFGLVGKPKYNAMIERKRKYWECKPEWYLLELFPKDLKGGDLEEFYLFLKKHLEKQGVNCCRLSEEEIWQRSKRRAIDHFTKVVKSFIERCRKLCLTPDELSEKINNHSCDDNELESHFLKLVQRFYKFYLDYLKDTGEDDFDGLIQKAIERINSGYTQFCYRFNDETLIGELKSLRFISVDEYQDFSELFHRLMKAVRNQNQAARLFCVGDDWQAINSFAGSDLYFYQQFSRIFQPSQKLEITTNYRSTTSIVEISNTLMQSTGGTLARPDKTEKGLVKIVDLATFKPLPSEKETHKGDRITPIVLRLVTKSLRANKDVVLLSRTNHISGYVNYTKKDRNIGQKEVNRFQEHICSFLPGSVKDKITVSTTHSFKGDERKVVIVLDAVSSRYPLIHSDWIFTRILGNSAEQVIDEERRLFYVALTRAEERLYIFVEEGNESPFIEEVRNQKNIPTLNWADYPGLITVKVMNQPGKPLKSLTAIEELLQFDGYEFQHQHWQKAYPIYEFSIPTNQFFKQEDCEEKGQESWQQKADGVRVEFYGDANNLLAIYCVNKGNWTRL